MFVPRDSTVIETAALNGTDARLLMDVERDENGRFQLLHNRQSLYPVWSPDGRHLAFVSNRAVAGGDYAYGFLFFVMDADGTNVKALAPSVEAANDPSIQWLRWSPDGSWLTFVGFELDEERNKVYGLFTVQPDGSGLTLTANTLLADMSPDGSRLAFVAEQTDADGNTYLTIQTVRPDGTDVISVGKLEGTGVYNAKPSVYGEARRIYQPVWSPDGAWLAFVDDRGAFAYDRGIVVVRPDGSDLQELMIHREAGINGVESRRAAETNGPGVMWTPDGEEVWTRDLAFAVRPDGSGLRKVIPGGIPNVVRTAWSPDGSLLAVLTINEAGQFKLLAVDRNGTDKRLLVRGSGVRIVAEHSGWRDVSADIAACAELYKDNPGLVEDCQTLLRIRDTLAGESLLNWSADAPIGSWEGVSFEGGAEGDPPRVRKLVLAGSSSYIHYITGVIPPELGSLSELEFLNLARNNLTGNIPPELGDLASLKSLYLDDNMLSGDVPPELGNLENLIRLSLGRNFYLSGCVPVVLADRLNPDFNIGMEYCE